MQGQIVKILSDSHFVNDGVDVTVCKCRGIFRKNHIIPLVGDYVTFSKEEKIITDILKRKNALVRPSVANIDQGFIITSVKNPDFSINLLDKLLVVMEYNKVKPIICVTKLDLINEEEKKKVFLSLDYYKKIGYTVVENTEVDKIKKLFSGNTSVFTGQTGAGKSSLLNRLDSNLELETGEISLALGRGKHTTRHVELIELFGGKVLDTPGFSSLDFSRFTKEDIRDNFIEFRKYHCKYQDCMHLKEDDCMVKKAVLENEILKERYETYQKLMEERKDLW